MKKKLDLVTICSSILLIVGVFVATVISPEGFNAALQAARKWCIYRLGAIIIVFVALLLFFVLYIAFSKFGEIRMGKTKPTYSWFGYAAMVFCAAMGSSMIFWPSVEWAEYICGTSLIPFGWSTAEMAKYSISYSFFHWGLPAWAIYAVGIIPVGYRYHVMEKPGLSIQGAMEGAVSPRALKGGLGTFVNILFVFGTLGGLTITYGTGIPMINNFMNNVFGTPETFWVRFLIVLVLTVIFSISALKGIGKGILKLSYLCIIFCGIMLGLVFVLGDTGFIVAETGRSIGYHFQNFFPMLFNLEGFDTGSSFSAEWTVFYWAWWIGLAPVMWIFIAKCSKGMTLRNIILTVLGSGFLSTVIFFGILSGNGKSFYKDFDWSQLGQSNTALDRFFGSWNEYQFISDTLTETSPHYKIILAIWIVGCIILLATTMDSAAFTLSEATQKNIPLGESPDKKLRLFWAVMLSVIPLCLMAFGFSTSAFISIVILSAVPITLIVILSIVGSMKWIFKDYGKMSRKEIREHFKVEE